MESGNYPATPDQRDWLARTMGFEDMDAWRRWNKILSCPWTAEGIETAARLAGALDARVRIVQNRTASVIVWVEVTEDAEHKTIFDALQQIRPVGIDLHVLNMMPFRVTIVRPALPETLWEKFRAYVFGTEFERDDVLET